MACRLHNLHDKTLGIDLRGGEVLMLPPHTTSRAIREEALYDNHHLPEWERAGWIRRIPARMDDVIAEAPGAQRVDARHKAPEAGAAEKEAKAEAKAEKNAETNAEAEPPAGEAESAAKETKKIQKPAKKTD